MFKAFQLPSTRLLFGSSQSHHEKLPGLYEFGPYRPIPVNTPVRFGFVFPTENRDQANDLFRALRSGIGLFRGVESTFRFWFARDSVFPISGFSISGLQNQTEIARKYVDAILMATSKGAKADLFFVLSPYTPRWERETTYYETKATLLQQGIISQTVTLELLEDRYRFEWSIANIALATFVKLGGVPWIVQADDVVERDLIIGIGKAELFDPLERRREESDRVIGFTACFSARGLFKFLSLGSIANTRNEYLALLDEVVSSSLTRALKTHGAVSSLTLHVPKEMGNDEDAVIRRAVKQFSTQGTDVRIYVFKVSDEEQFFLTDDSVADRAVPRGTVVQIADEEFLLYTEGREERQSWTTRPPSALRVRPQAGPYLRSQILDSLRKINDLSQINWRGLNAQARPISIEYGNQIARLLSHVPAPAAHNLYTTDSKRVLEERMWFI